MNPSRRPLYFDDLHVGDKFPTASVTVTEAEIIAFAQLYDPQPFHTDPAAAPASLFGRLVASGWHTAALTMRLLVQGEFQLAGGSVGLGVEKLEWPRPVLPGDTLTVVTEVVEKRPSSSKPDRGLVRARSTTFNQRQEPVQRLSALLIVLCRPA
ncbi:MAG: MaoC family dehydratase [Opitutae bacterium]|nr:MaoC family dehydratase [Opitutae bacterium]